MTDNKLIDLDPMADLMAPFRAQGVPDQLIVQTLMAHGAISGGRALQALFKPPTSEPQIIAIGMPLNDDLAIGGIVPNSDFMNVTSVEYVDNGGDPEPNGHDLPAETEEHADADV